MDLRRLIGLFSLIFFFLGLSMVLWTSVYAKVCPKEQNQLPVCGCTADNASPEDYARVIDKALKAKAGGTP